MDSEDIRELRAERGASPSRWQTYDPGDGFRRHYPLEQQAATPRAPSNGSSRSSVEIQEIGTGNQARPAGSSSRRDTTASTATGSSLGRTRTETERINHMERHPEALHRIETHRTQHGHTVGPSVSRRTTAKSSTEKPLPAFGAGKPYPPVLPAQEEYVVEFEGHDDPLHPQNWPMRKKLVIGACLSFDSLAATMGSSIFSDATGVVAMDYGVSMEVGTLATSLFVLGYAFGPIVWAPMSELYGRRIPILIAAFGFSIFTIGVATAENLQTIMLCRFFSGAFGSCPLVCVAAVFADIFNNEIRGLAVAVFSATVFMGPLLAPFIGGFIVDSYLGWRWTMYISSFMGFAALVLLFFFLEESYGPVVLVSKASELRRRTKNWGIHSKQEEIEVDFKELLTKNISRPMRILFTEPIVLAITIYMSFIYGLLYLFLTAYALVFQQVHGFNAGVGGLPYFGMVTGEVIGFITIVFLNPSYIRKLKANNNVPVPEWRIPVAILGGILFSIGLFWFGWTGYKKEIPWIVPTLSGLCSGFGIFTIFLQLLNYIVDAYLMFAASALAGNTFLRSLAGAVFPLFATYMFNGMGINYALTLLGCVAAVLVPMPVIFLLYGAKIRARSKFAPGYDLKQAQQKKDEESGSSGSDADGEKDSPALEKQTTNASRREEIEAEEGQTDHGVQRERAQESVKEK